MEKCARKRLNSCLPALLKRTLKEPNFCCGMLRPVKYDTTGLKGLRKTRYRVVNSGNKIMIDNRISNQQMLPFRYRRRCPEVLLALRDLAPGGGFVYGASHYTTYEVPM
jgi:hypothetical protein